MFKEDKTKKNFVLRRQKQSTKSIERMHRNNT